MRHTPGPWANNGGRIEAGGSYGEPSFEAIAVVGIINQQDHHDTANARLIAAAPDLLAALRVLQTMLHDLPMPAANNVINHAIAKAQGE